MDYEEHNLRLKWLH